MGKRLGLTLTLIAGIMWGTSFPVVRVGLEGGLDPIQFVFLRFILASVFMLILCLLSGKNFVHYFMDKYTILLGVINTFSFILQFEGQAHASASVASLIVNMSAIITAVGSSIFLKEKFGLAKLISIFLAVFGAFLLTTNLDIKLPGTELTGIVLLSFTSLSWGFYAVLNKFMIDNRSVEYVSFSTSVVLLTSVLCFPLVLFSDLKLESIFTFPVFYTAVFNTAVPYMLYQKGLESLTATSSSILLLIEPVVAILISVVLLKETLAAFQIIGAVMVLCSIYIVSIK